MKTIILEANKSITAVMAGAPAATQPDFTSAFADSFTVTFGVDTEDGVFNGTTPITLVSAPSSAGRDVREIIIFNKDSADVTITVFFNNNGTLRTIDKFTLAPDEKWVFSEAGAAGGTAGVTDHGALSGLTDDDHTQYFKDGAQDLAGGAYQLSGFKGLQNVQTDSYTTVDSDLGKVIVMNKATGVTVTVHQGAAADFNCLVIQKGAGQVTFAAGGTGAIRNRSSHTKIAGQYGMASVYVESNAGTAPQVYIAGDTGA